MKKGAIFLLVVIAVTVFIISSWFSEGKIISNHSEEDLNIFHSQRSAANYSTFWYPGGTGLKIAFNMPRYPTFALLGFLENLNIPVFLRQAILLGVLMIAGILFMFIFLNQGLKTSYPVAFLGSLFYLLNIYSMTQVWRRFLYDGIFAWAYAPLFIFLWMKWVDNRKKVWLLFFLFSSQIFTYTFVHPAHLIAFWSIAAIFTLTAMWINRYNRKILLKIVLKSLVGFILWVIANLWWFYPILTIGSSWTAQSGQTWKGDLDSLIGVSKYFPVWDILTLRQSWYMGSENNWILYQNPLSYLPSIAVLFLVVYGAMKMSGQYKKFLVSLALVGLFVSKGTNFPFGYTLFYLLFSNFPLTAALRNSYEKFGLVWLLPYTVFFASGLYFFLLRFKPRLRYLYGGLIIILLFGLLVYPMWNKDIFPQKHRLIPPTYYIKANEYLKSASSERIFHMPFMSDIEIVRYKWGYSGEDPTENLFETQTVSKAGLPIFRSYLGLIPKYLDNKKLGVVLGLLGVDRIVLHKDIIYPDPAFNHLQTREDLSSLSGVTKEIEIGELSIYKLDNDLVKPRIYAIQLQKVASLEDGLDKVINGEIDTKKTGFISASALENKLDGSIPNLSFERISNDHFKISVQNASGPFNLVLNDTFDSLWQAKIGKDIIKPHFIVNGFANGWFVEKTGNYTIEITLKVWPWE